MLGPSPREKPEGGLSELAKEIAALPSPRRTSDLAKNTSQEFMHVGASRERGDDGTAIVRDANIVLVKRRKRSDDNTLFTSSRMVMAADGCDHVFDGAAAHHPTKPIQAYIIVSMKRHCCGHVSGLSDYAEHIADMDDIIGRCSCFHECSSYRSRKFNVRFVGHYLGN